MIKKEVLEVLPELSDVLVPQCKYLMWCPETHGCGGYPSKKELESKINSLKE